MPKVVYYIDNDENSLTHYGRLGMKWGQHIFTDDDVYNPNKKSAKRIQKGLNKIEKKRAKYVRKKYNRARNKVVRKYTEKRYKKFIETKEALEEGKKFTKNTIDKIKKSGNFDIESVTMPRYKAIGADYVNGFLYGLPGGIVSRRLNPVDSTGYIVKKRGG